MVQAPRRAAATASAAARLACALLLSAAPAAAQVRTQAGLDSLVQGAIADSSDPAAHQRLGLAYLYHGRYDDAERAFRRAVAIDPHYAPALLGLSYLPYYRRPRLRKEEEKGRVPPELAAQVAEANELRRRAIMIDPFARAGGTIEIVLMPAWTREPISPKRLAKMPLEFFWVRGIYLALGGELPDALADFEVLLERLEAAGDSTENGLIPLVANEVRYVMAVIEIQAGRSASAAKRLEEVLTHDVGLYMAHARLADIHEKNGRFTAAITERRRAVEGSPDDPMLLYELGYTLARANALRAADSALTRAMDLNARNSAFPRMAGLVRHTLGDTARARQAYERFLAIAPSTRSRDVAEVRSKLAELH